MKSTPLVCAVACAVFCGGNVNGQGFLWGRQIGVNAKASPPLPSSSAETPSKVAVDREGNAYITGNFLGTAIFGSTNLSSAGDFDLFLAKYDAAGGLLWIVQGGGTGLDLVADVAVDPSGNVYITGSFPSSMSLAGTELEASGAGRFVAKFSSAGVLAWARAGSGQGFGIDVDVEGNTYCTGSGAVGILIEKRDPSGVVLWQHDFGGVRGQDVKVDSAGNVFVVGEFEGTVNFGTNVLSIDFWRAIFVTKLDSGGNFLWARQAGTDPGDMGQSVAIDNLGNALVVGTFGTTIDFGSTNLTTATQIRPDAFLAKYSPSGDVLWARPIASPDSDRGWGVATDTNGDSYVCGYVQPNQAFVRKYNPAGELLWVVAPGHTGGSSAYGVAVDPYGDVYLTGSCTGDIYLDRFGLTNLLSDDIFVGKISEDVPPVFLVNPEVPRSVKPMGDGDFTFNSAVRSVYPVTYQWQFQGTNMPGGTNSSLTLSNLQAGAQGDYFVIASNLFGAATSTVASLIVYFRVNVLTNGTGSVLVNPRALDFPAYSGVSLSAQTNSGMPFMQWIGSITGTNPQVSLVVTSHISTVALFADSITNIVMDDLDPRVTFTGNWGSTVYAGMYVRDFRTAPSSTEVTATAVFRPTIVVPGYYDVFIWSPSWYLSTPKAPWTIVSNGGTFTTNVSQGGFGNGWGLIGAGMYFSSGTNGYVSVANNAGSSAFRVIADAVRLAPSTPPQITFNPLSQTVTAGSAVGFMVRADGTPPLFYQWQLNGNDLANATNGTLAIASAQPRDAGVYRVIVSNFLGEVPSSGATLLVSAPPRPLLSSFQINAAQQFELTLTGASGIIVLIETSTNLLEWSAIATLTNSTGAIRFTDPETNGRSKFYRAEWLGQ